MKRLISLCLVCLLLVSTAGTGVLAAEEASSGLSSAQSGTDGRLEVPDAGISIELPEDMYIIYKGFLLEDPVLEEAGIEDPTQLKEEFNQYGTCMQLISKDRSINITINKKSSDSTQNIYNLGALDDAGFQQVLDSMKPSDVYKRQPLRSTAFFRSSHLPCITMTGELRKRFYIL